MTIVQFHHRDGILDLGWGHPRPALLPVSAWAAAHERALSAYGWQALTYGHATGPAPLLDWLSAHLGDAAPAQTFVTAGTSHGLSLVTQVLAAPGDVVLVDSPTYHLAFKILTDLGVRLVPVRADDPSAVAALAREHRPAFLYLVPTFGNPTGASLPADRRRELVSSGLTIVEDDTYRELSYAGAAPDALWRLAPGANVVRLGTFSKTVAPGLRLGWVNAAAPIVERLARLGSVHSGGGVNHTTAMTMAEFGASGAYDRHVAVLRESYRAQRDALTGALGVAAPAGGWFVWLRLPAGVGATRLLPIAERHGTSFLPGPVFHVDGGGEQHVRLSFSHLSAAGLAEAGARLRAAIAAA
ncbi:PLP-dependent aminotransferase family protein [Actinoplanes sp. URMC 104]|uniref:aminotransferase-like domain-containing protein n=1 Tax=Actinoplanes sp. URMC 104 TaxID=3423409 RepID=UPI003F1BAB21